MRASFVFSEVLTGLRRNVTMTVAMIITTMMSLALLGIGLLVVQMIDKTQAVYRDEVDVNVFLTDDVSANDDSCSQEPCAGLQQRLEADPAVQQVTFENREKALERFRQIFDGQPELLKLVRAESLPASFSVKLKDPDRPEVITQVYSGTVGVESIGDESEYLEDLFEGFNGIRNVTFVIALFQAVAALLLISNTVQVSAFTRRTEVNIMRLVGATRWYTQLPFLLEAVVAGLTGAVLAIGLLVAFKELFLDDVMGGLFATGVVQPVEGLDILMVSPWLLLISVGISAITGYFTLRLYVRQ